jgi:hypothetical protein
MEFAPLNANGCKHYVNDFYQEAPFNKFFFSTPLKNEQYVNENFRLSSHSGKNSWDLPVWHCLTAKFFSGSVKK